MIVFYVDDVIIVSKQAAEIENLLASLKNGMDIDTGQLQKGLKKFSFTDDGAIKTFLGVSVEKAKDGYHLSQPHLIARILDAVNLNADDSSTRNIKDTPVVKPLLLRDTNGESRQLPWNYRSVVGMLNYLSGSTRPDISIAVHQVARFSTNPKRSHEKAVMRIARYLRSTARFGTFYKIDLPRDIEVFVDADFAGTWTHETALDPNSVLSRTGYVMLLF